MASKKRARKRPTVQFSDGTRVLVCALVNVLGPDFGKALRTWARQPTKERESLIEYLEAEAREAPSIAHGDLEFGRRWKRENERAAALLRALGAALGLP